jgi:hypothetical protein
MAFVKKHCFDIQPINSNPETFGFVDFILQWNSWLYTVANNVCDMMELPMEWVTRCCQDHEFKL